MLYVNGLKAGKIEKTLWLITWVRAVPKQQFLCDVLNKQVRSNEAPPWNLKVLKDLRPTFWYQIPQYTFRADLVAQVGHTEY